ncbi:MAG: helix-turn-helix domain-containing protein [Sandaracinaceae bacterium]
MGVRVEACEGQLALAMCGQLSAPRAAARDLDNHGSALARAWAILLRAAIGGLSEPTSGPEPRYRVEALRGHGPEVDRVLARACSFHERRAFAAFDVHGLERWRSCRPRGADRRVAAEDMLSDMRLAVLVDRPFDQDQRRRAVRAGQTLEAPELVVESVALGGLADLAAGDTHEARASCRRASRISRTEGLLELEYLANLVLARMRRHTGRAHAATAILHALTRVCSAPWRGWLAWELAFVSCDALAGRALAGAGDGPAAELARAVRKTLDGDRDAAARMLNESAPMVAREARALVACRHGPQGIGVDEQSARFLRGDTHEVPMELSGLATQRASAGSLVWVKWDPEQGARRYLATASDLDAGIAGGLELSAREERSAVSLATLLFAGPDGCRAPDLYRATFGGTYDPAAHDGLLRTTLYRARAALGARGSLERKKGVVVLHPTEPLAIPDPRCAADVETRVLSLLAARGSASAAEIAHALHISVRKVQKSLRRLLDEGACEQLREGRQIRYVLEDTTFSEPTVQRLQPGG